MVKNFKIMKKKKATVTFSFPNDHEHKYDIKCHSKAVELNSSVWDALQKIRARLKYSTNVSDAERTFLTELQSYLYENYVEG
jgi:hypothetical protein